MAVVTRDDVLALRLTLLSAHLRPDLPLWVTMFDRTITRELGHVVPAVHVLSPAELVAAELAEHCIAATGRPPSARRGGTRLVDDALRLLVRAGVGLLLVLLFEGSISMIALHERVIDALYFSTRSVATVAGVPGAASAAAWFKVLSAVDMLLALLLVAVFTAALFRRLSRPAPDHAARSPRPPRRATTCCSSASGRSAFAWRRSSRAAGSPCWASSETRTPRAYDLRGRRDPGRDRARR